MEEIYTTDRWEQVPAGDFAPPLQVKAGDALDFRCDYMNPEAREVVQGLTTRDEMCMLIGPYYPRDPLFDMCFSDAGFPAESWIGSGAASCAETLIAKTLSTMPPIMSSRPALRTRWYISSVANRPHFISLRFTTCAAPDSSSQRNDSRAA